MTRPLGKRQLRLLSVLGTPGTALIVPCKVSESLVRRGYAASAAADSDGFVHITAAGLRALADEADAGRLALAPDLDRYKRQKEDAV